jgi:hypothetical protein
MPKIRDLGINAIPSTMRPPEIGPGGAYPQEGNDDGRFLELTCTCTGNPDGSTNPKPTCHPKPSGPPSPGCEAQSNPPKGWYAGAFDQSAVEQLRRQLEDQLGSERLN